LGTKHRRFLRIVKRFPATGQTLRKWLAVLGNAETTASLSAGDAIPHDVDGRNSRARSFEVASLSRSTSNDRALINVLGHDSRFNLKRSCSSSLAYLTRYDSAGVTPPQGDMIRDARFRRSGPMMRQTHVPDLFIGMPGDSPPNRTTSVFG
jgi:hypothetical protein